MSTSQPFFSRPLLDAYVTSLDQGTPLNEALETLARYIEQKSPVPLFASILLLDQEGSRLFRGAAPSLPENYSNEIDGIKIGPNAGSCGTAVFCGHPIYVSDIDRDELWAEFKHLALPYGLRACWSVPILSNDGQILGTFALYYTSIRTPTLEERAFIAECAVNAALLIESSRKVSKGS